MTKALGEVVKVVAELCGAPELSLTPHTRLTADLGLDSVRAVELMLDVEERLGCMLPEVVLRDVRTLGDLARAVDAARGAGDA